MKFHPKYGLVLYVILLICTCCNGWNLQAVCKENNDLVNVLRTIDGLKQLKCVSTLHEAIKLSEPNGTVLFLAPGYPSVWSDVTSAHATMALKLAAQQNISIFVEFPSGIPGTSLTVNNTNTNLERVVVTKDVFGPNIPVMTIMKTNIVTYVQFQPDFEASQLNTSLVFAKVAGYDIAVYGLPPHNVFPALVTVNKTSQLPLMVIATTQLSGFVTHRFAPETHWKPVWQQVLRWLNVPNEVIVNINWQRATYPNYSKDQVLPDHALAEAFRTGVEWYLKSGLIPDANRTMIAAKDLTEGYDLILFPKHTLSGSGSMGIFEGFFSTISQDGRQPTVINLRCDCISETAMSFALRGLIDKSSKDLQTSRYLMDYIFMHGGFSRYWMPGVNDPLGDAFGLLVWSSSVSVSSSDQYYKDDNARSILAGIAASSFSGDPHWLTTLATAILGNLRITGTDGFGPSSQFFSDIQKHGWFSYFNRSYGDDESLYSPHYQSYLWAVYLWAYNATGYQPLYDRSYTAIKLMMQNYPSKWQATANGVAMQKARMLLPLAWLYRVNPTNETKTWLMTIYQALKARQQESGAIMEQICDIGWGSCANVPDNENYGTFEAPLNQEDTDPVTDLLYTSNFAFLGLTEAAFATNDEDIWKSLQIITDFFIRVQSRSKIHHQFDGAYFRAFDFEKWEVWGSDADVGWGATAIETGWTQSWITTCLGLRILNTSLWDRSSTIRQSKHPNSMADLLNQWLPVFIPFPVPPPPPPPSPPPIPPPPCIPWNGTTNIIYDIETSISELCAPAPGKSTSTLQYHGHLCSKTGILWTDIYTLNPRGGLSPSNCIWNALTHDESWQQLYTGSCEKSPIYVPDLPNSIC